jgi:glucose/arabinose dehydrogenase/sugar lactone lactonase YvrE
MNRHLWFSTLILLTFAAITSAQQQPPKPWVTGLKNPESVAVGVNGKTYVSVIGEFNKDGDGAVMVIEDGKAVPFTTGLDDPKGLVSYLQWLYVADRTRIWRIDPKGKAEVYVAAGAFPKPPLFLNDLAVDVESGTLYASDSGDLKGKGGAVYRIDPKGKVTLVLDEKTLPAINIPNGLLMDGQSHLLLVDFGSGELHRIKLADSSTEKLADGFGGGDGLIWDHYGRLFISDYKNGKVFVINRPGDKPVLMAQGFKAAADICLDATGANILVPDMNEGTVTVVPIKVPGAEVDTTPMKLKAELAFPNLKWAGWQGETDDGKINQFRPLMLTHAGDGSNRIFVGEQHGYVHVFPNDQNVNKSEIFLDIHDRVAYDDKTNEEGFLGMAFHPKYKENGEFFVFYTPKNRKLTNVVSRFKVSKDNPNRGDPGTEEELMQFTKIFWNHDGGTICFGPDGYLYVTHGDGGLKDDPQDQGQNLKSLLGKIHRIDVDHPDTGKKYGIPKDNPFVGKADVLPEIWAYGLRNVWRMSFDRKTGQLWAADVGQNLYEEIDLIQPGANLGWNRREGLHPFGPKGVNVNKNMIDPIWEYHHDVGKSITGGHVYRGTRLPELDGAYLYGDYVSNRIWALWHDAKKGRVVANRPIKDYGLPVYSFGEDEKGEVYVMTASQYGRGIYWFVKE